MTWLRIDTAMPRHPKLLSVGHADRWAHLTAMAWCAENYTDGVIRRPFLRAAGATPAVASRLVSAGLWEVIEGGWKVHDWEDYNIPADDAKRRREAERDRKRRYRSRQDGTRDKTRDGTRESLATRARVDPSRPPSPDGEGTGRREEATTTPTASTPAPEARPRSATERETDPMSHKDEIGGDGLARWERDDLERFRNTGDPAFLREIAAVGSPAAKAAAAAAAEARAPELRAVEGNGQ